MTRRRRGGVWLLLALLAFALGLAACGGDDGEEAAPPAAAEPAPAEPTAPAEPPAEEPAPAEPPAEEPAPEVESIRIALDFTPNTNHSGIYVALANGYFEEQGIEAEVIPVRIRHASDRARRRRRGGSRGGLPGRHRDPGRGRHRPEDGRGDHPGQQRLARDACGLTARRAPPTSPARSTAATGHHTRHRSSSAILAGAGVEPVFEEVILSTGAIEALSSGDVDFSAVYEGWSEIGAEIAGSPLKTFPYKDYVEGYIFPDVVFVTSGELIGSKGDALKRALVALGQGYAFAAENPAETAEILTTQVPELGQSQELVSRSAEFRAPAVPGRVGQMGLPARGAVHRGRRPPHERRRDRREPGLRATTLRTSCSRAASGGDPNRAEAQRAAGPAASAGLAARVR